MVPVYKNKSTFLWNFFLNFGLGKFRFDARPLVYHNDRQALFTARFRRAGHQRQLRRRRTSRLDIFLTAVALDDYRE